MASQQTTPPAPPAPDRPPGGPGSLFIFDGYNFIFRAFHAIPLLNAPDGTPINAVHQYIRMVQAVRREFAPERLLAVFDAGGDGGRRKIFQEYKAHRPPPPDDLIPQFPLIREATDRLRIPRCESPDYEADDLIASYACQALEQGINVTIVSSDKDLMQLCQLGDGRPYLLLWDTMKNRAIGPAEVYDKFGVLPDRLGDLLALTGDSSDNIPGVPGIGPKTASALLAEYGDLEGVLAGAPDIKQKKRRERLIEHAEDARLSRKLVELSTDLPLPLPLDRLTDPGPDLEALIEFGTPLGLVQVLRELGATGVSRQQEVKRGGSAPVAGDEGAIELVSAGAFESAADRYRLLMGDDEPVVRKLVKALKKARRLAVHVVTDSPDPLAAKVVGVSLAAEGVDEDGDPAYLPFGHLQVDLVEGRQLSQAVAVELLGPLLSDPKVPKIVYDHKEASHPLRRLGIELRGVVLDPMLVSYTLDPARTAHDLTSLCTDVLVHKLTPADTVLGKGRKARAACDVDPASIGPWACENAEVVLALGKALEQQAETAPASMRKLLSNVEMPLADVLQRIERRGICLDVSVLDALSEELEHSIAKIQGRVRDEVGHEVNLDSPLQLQKLLFEDRGLPPTRKTKTGYSTDARALEELSVLDPIVRDILEYRQVVKLKNTYVDALPRLVREETGRLHTSFNQAVASTGRLSSSDPNLQNIPIRSEAGRRIRQAFVAEKGRVLVALDYSQIELRILAHLSGDPNLMSAFIEGVDVHRRTAAEVFGVDEDQVDDEQRRIAKAVNFGVVYGQTAFGLAQQLGIPRGKAGSYIRAYFEKIPGVDRYMRELIEVAKARGYAETILGRRRRIPELARKGAARSHGERMARNTPIQGSAADILKLAMIEVDKVVEPAPWADMLLTVHDELIFECDEDRVDDLVALAQPKMENAVELSVPLHVDIGAGKTWADCKGG